MIRQLILPLAFVLVPVAAHAQAAPVRPAALATAEARLAAGDFSAARTQYRTAASELARAQRDPSQPLRQAANMAYALGDLRDARVLLDEATVAAARFGNVAGQAEAVLASAYVAAELGDRRGVRDQLARLADLEQSPVLPEPLRRTVREALATQVVGVR
jgi:hypothetical protein